MRYVCTEDNEDVLEIAPFHDGIFFFMKDETFGDVMSVFLSKGDVTRLIDDLKTCLESMGD